MKNLRKLIEQEESETREKKSSLSNKKRIVEIACSFANRRGGTIIIGASSEGRIKNVDIGKQTIEQLTNLIVDRTDPKIYPEVLVHKIDDKNIITINVKESSNKPHLAYGRAFIRIGKNTKPMSRDEYERLLLKRKPQRFDSEICKEATLSDIDGGRIRWFLKKAKAERNCDVDPETPVKEALEKLKLMQNGNLTNAAILLFGRDVTRFFLQAETRCARFKGTTVSEFLDMKVFNENLFDQVDNAEIFVLRNISKAAWVSESGKLEREEKYEYPPKAIREAIVNAVCHRDYGSTANVQIRIFDDRIETWSPGLLPEPLTPEDLRRKHDSIPRNPLIAKCFFLVKFIEQWGTGTNRMIEKCLQEGLPEPLFEETARSFVVTMKQFYVSGEVLRELNERQVKIVEYLREHKKITKQGCIGLLDTSKNTALRELNALIEKKIIIRKGHGKNAYYVFI